MDAKALLIFVGMIAILYPLLMRVLAISAQHTRLKMADLGNELLRSDQLDSEQKQIVAAMLENAFDWKLMVLFTFCVPVFAWLSLRGKMPSSPLANVPADLAPKLNKMLSYSQRSAAAANPLFLLLAVAMFVVCIVPMVIISKLIGDHFGSLRETLRTILALTEDRARQDDHSILNHA